MVIKHTFFTTEFIIKMTWCHCVLSKISLFVLSSFVITWMCFLYCMFEPVCLRAALCACICVCACITCDGVGVRSSRLYQKMPFTHWVTEGLDELLVLTHTNTLTHTLLLYFVLYCAELQWLILWSQWSMGTAGHSFISMINNICVYCHYYCDGF